jgi:transposase
LTIAKIGKFETIKLTDSFDVDIYSLKNLCRDYYNLTDTHSQYKKKLTSDLYIMFPGYCDVFDDVTGKTSIAILTKYQTPQAILATSKEELLETISIGKQTITWRNNTYDKLIDAAKNACLIGIPTSILSIKLNIYLDTLQSLDKQLKIIVDEIKKLINSENISDSFRKNLSLIQSIPGMGFITAVTILVELGSFDKFLKPKHLVAFFGIDPSVNESGKFKSSRNKISKRGTSFGRRALYTLALASVRKSNNGKLINPVIHEYYQGKVDSKKKKATIVAVMHKLVNYIFAVLRDQKNFELRAPDTHRKAYFNKTAA